MTIALFSEHYLTNWKKLKINLRLRKVGTRNWKIGTISFPSRKIQMMRQLIVIRGHIRRILTVMFISNLLMKTSKPMSAQLLVKKKKRARVSPKMIWLNIFKSIYTLLIKLKQHRTCQLKHQSLNLMSKLKMIYLSWEIWSLKSWPVITLTLLLWWRAKLSKTPNKSLISKWRSSINNPFKSLRLLKL